MTDLCDAKTNQANKQNAPKKGKKRQSRGGTTKDTSENAPIFLRSKLICR